MGSFLLNALNAIFSRSLRSLRTKYLLSIPDGLLIPTAAPRTLLRPPLSFLTFHLYTLLLSKIHKLFCPLPNSLVNATVWDTTSASLSVHHKPLSIILKDPSPYITKLQYSLLIASLCVGLKPIISLSNLLTLQYYHSNSQKILTEPYT